MTKLEKTYNEILIKLYKNCEPSGDFENIKKSKEGLMRNWFMAYYISSEKQNEIIENISIKNKLNKSDKNKIFVSLALGYSPTNSREVMEKERKDYGERLKKHFELLKDFKEPTICKYCSKVCEKEIGYCDKCEEFK